MFGQGKGVSLMKSAAGGQDTFVKEPANVDISKQFFSDNSTAIRVRKGARPMHTSTLFMSDNCNWQDRTTYDKEYNSLHSKSNQREKAFSYPDTLKALGFDEFHRFEPHYAEQFCKEKPLTKAADLQINRLAIGAKQMDSVGVKDVMRQQPPVYITQYGRTHAYLGLLKSIEPQPKKEDVKRYGYLKEAIHDPITGDIIRNDVVPSRGFKKSSAGKLIEDENNKFKPLRSIISDGIF